MTCVGLVSFGFFVGRRRGFFFGCDVGFRGRGCSLGVRDSLKSFRILGEPLFISGEKSLRAAPPCSLRLNSVMNDLQFVELTVEFKIKGAPH